MEGTVADSVRQADEWVGSDQLVDLSGVTPGYLTTNSYRVVGPTTARSRAAHERPDTLDGWSRRRFSEMNPVPSSVEMLARHYAACEFSEEALLECGDALSGGKRKRWVEPVAKNLEAAFSGRTRPRRKQVEAELCRVMELMRVLERPVKSQLPDLSGELFVREAMRPVAAAKSWSVLPATDFGELAGGLELHGDDLGWLTMGTGATSHYHYVKTQKRDGKRGRFIEVPKPMMKAAQRSVLDLILEKIPVHEKCCGFVRGKSVHDFVRSHCGKEMVLKLDLKNFFPGIGSGRVARIFLTAGYPEYVSELLTKLTTNGVGDTVESLLSGLGVPESERVLFEKPHLPQGAPTSPMLANFCAYRLDCRLSGLAEASGVVYSRYADDLLFSGGKEFARAARRFHRKVLEVIIDEGFRVNLRKTRFMPSSQRQFAVGMVLNETARVSRRERDALRAILHNCRERGWRSQNRRDQSDFQSHLAGRIEWMSQGDPAFGERLRLEFQKIDWR